ncbi:MAG: hypothetical protein KGM15_04100 [Pseudomonadota bacterium]|nr:hypothetical protein [Pseudomonadota bacterium]
MRSLALAFVLLATPALAARTPADLHDGVNVGMPASELPKTDYKNFACVEPKGKALTGFDDWKSCAAGADGLHKLHVAIDEPGEDETLVAGHPVDLTLGFNDEGRLASILIVTKSKGPMFLRKKGYLLGLQAKARYGDEGWSCQEIPLGADEEPLGPTSIKEHCVKTAGDRRVTVDRSLFRKIGAEEKAFTSESRVTIDWVGK